MTESFIYGQGGADRTLHDKEVLLYRFAEFMRRRGYHAYLPDIRTKYPASRHIPHIYTEDERRRFLEAVDSYPQTPNSSRNTVDPVLFRFLCGTGCRLSEALNLRIADFDYCLGAVTVRHAKNDRSRIVPLCGPLTERIHSYINSFHAGCGSDSYLFPGAKRGKMDRSTAYTHFRDYLLMADIPHPKDGPRIHDWRHTLAVENLRRWSGEGLDLANMVTSATRISGLHSITCGSRLKYIRSSSVSWKLPAGTSSRKEAAMKKPDLHHYVTSYFRSYLPGQKNLSRNTISGYADAFRLLFSFCEEKKGMRVERL